MQNRFSSGSMWFLMFIGSSALSSAAFAQLQNGDFELPGEGGTQPQGWTMSQGKMVQDDHIRTVGKFAGKLDGADGPASAFQDVAVEPGKAYALTGKWRNGDKTADFDIVSAGITWLTGAGGAPVGSTVVKDSGSVINNWSDFQVTGLAPADAHVARIMLKSRFGIGAFDGLNWAETDPSNVQAAAPAAATGKSVPPKLTTAMMGNGGETASAPATAAASNVNWLTDFESGRKAATSQQKAILLYFIDPDSDLTQYYDSKVLSQPAVQEALSKYVLVKLPFAPNKDMAYKLKVFRGGSIVAYDNRGAFKTLLQEKLPPADVAQKLAQ